MKESDTGRIKKTDQAQKIRTEICRIFFNRQMAFNPLHLNHLQQVRCCCWCKVKNSESKSQRRHSFEKTKHEAQELNPKSLKAMIKNCHLWSVQSFGLWRRRLGDWQKIQFVRKTPPFYGRMCFILLTTGIRRAVDRLCNQQSRSNSLTPSASCT